MRVGSLVLIKPYVSIKRKFVIGGPGYVEEYMTDQGGALDIVEVSGANIRLDRRSYWWSRQWLTELKRR